MAVKGRPFLLFLLHVAALLVSANGEEGSSRLVPFNRSSFPSGFIFGAGSSAYQSEGAALVDGRGPSIWDTFVRKQTNKIVDGSTGDIANDFYHRYKEDVKLMEDIGLDSFRFSISWTRILPSLKPFVTLLHFDPPQALDDEYGGFLSPKIVNDYLHFADLCFKTFGDRVKHWVTINEPNIFVTLGYDSGILAPGRCSRYAGNCTAGDSSKEPYVVAHHLLLCHAAAAKLYKEKYQVIQNGQIGITIASQWFLPKYNTSSSRIAVSRALDFFYGWFAYPVTFGNYPKIMRSLVGRRLPKFSEQQSQLLKGSYDFLGINYYTTNYADSTPSTNGFNLSYTLDMRINLTTEKNGVPIGTPTAVNWLFIYPKGLEELLLYTKKKYKNPTIYLTENGMADSASLPVEVGLKDSLRIRYLSGHLSYLLKAIKKGVRVKAYYTWSFFDDYEWNSGYTLRFGLTYIDYKNNLKRCLKYSAYWLKMFLLN